jgi:hypothetical protein
MSAPIGFDPKASMLPAGDGQIVGMKGGGTTPPLNPVNITELLNVIIGRLGDTPVESGKEVLIAQVSRGGGLKRKRVLKKRVRFELKDVTKE